MFLPDLPPGFEWRTYFGTKEIWNFVIHRLDVHDYPYRAYYTQIGPFWIHFKVKPVSEE